MDVFFRVKLEKTESMSLEDFFGPWIQETEAVLAAQDAGVIKWIYKVAGQYEVLGVMAVESAEQLDEIMHQLPVWRDSNSHLVIDSEWKPVTSYAGWSELMKKEVETRGKG